MHDPRTQTGANTAGHSLAMHILKPRTGTSITSEEILVVQRKVPEFPFL